MPAPAGPRVTRRDIVDGLRSVGVAAGDHVVVHSSLKSFGVVDDGPHGVIDALEEAITPAGTLVMPTFTSRVQFFLESLAVRYPDGYAGSVDALFAEVRSIWLDAGFTFEPFETPPELWARVVGEGVAKRGGWAIEPTTPDIAGNAHVSIRKLGAPLRSEECKPWLMPSMVGLVTETFRHRPEARRSEHYSGSFAAWGALTDRILERHDNHSAKVWEDHPLHRMREAGGKVLLLGVDHNRNSTIHVAEQWAVRRRGLTIDSEFLPGFMSVDVPLDECGGQRHGEIGAAHIRLADTNALYRVVDGILERLVQEGKVTT